MFEKHGLVDKDGVPIGPPSLQKSKWTRALTGEFGVGAMDAGQLYDLLVAEDPSSLAAPRSSSPSPPAIPSPAMISASSCFRDDDKNGSGVIRLPLTQDSSSCFR